MRMIFVLLLVVSPAGAAEVQLEGGFSLTNWGGSGAAPPVDYVFGLYQFPGDTLIAEAVIPGVMPSLVPQNWSIDESNAAAYGFDWQAAVDAIHLAIDDPLTLIARNRLNSGGASPPLRLNEHGSRVVEFDLTRIDLQVSYWIWSPAPSGHSESASWRLVGDGVVVPEPSCAALALMGFGIHAFTARRR